MSKKNVVKPVVAVVGAALVGSLSAANVAAAENPFGASALQGGYMQLAEAAGDKKPAEGKCGEGKCGGDKKAAEGKCGGDKKAAEGKCGEGKCGGDKKPAEGKCGGAK